jgi:putative oxidoreductase
VLSATGGGWEYPAFWTATVAVQALLGAGAYALRIPGVPELLGAGGARAVRA